MSSPYGTLYIPASKGENDIPSIVHDSEHYTDLVEQCGFCLEIKMIQQDIQDLLAISRSIKTPSLYEYLTTQGNSMTKEELINELLSDLWRLHYLRNALTKQIENLDKKINNLKKDTE